MYYSYYECSYDTRIQEQTLKLTDVGVLVMQINLVYSFVFVLQAKTKEYCDVDLVKCMICIHELATLWCPSAELYLNEDINVMYAICPWVT